MNQNDNTVLSILLLDVGQGDATIILPPGRDTAVVFDCKDDHVVDRHLRDFGVQRLEAVVVSHLDMDHIAGVKQLLESWRDRVGAVWIGTDRELTDEHDDAKTAKALVDYVTMPADGEERPPWRLLPPSASLIIAEGEDWSLRLLGPSQRLSLRSRRDGRGMDPNECSAILQVERTAADGTRRRVLIGGDAPLVAWNEVEVEDMGAEVFRNPHHGGALSDGGVPEGWTAAQLYDTVGAGDVVISVGTNNGHDHPNSEWCAPLAMRDGCVVRCTQVCPPCQPDIREDAVSRRAQVLEMRGRAEPAWRHLTATGRVSAATSNKEVPCAGTVVVGLSADGRVNIRPTAARHQRVVDLWAQPWCRNGFHTTEADDDSGAAWLEMLLSE